MTGGDALALQLRAEGTEVIFGLPGDQLMAALDALVDVPEIRYIVTRHEQATTYMADGYARASGRPGVAMVVPGVGVYNAASGLATAYACSSPVLLVSGQVNRHGIGRDLGLLHDVHDQLDIVRPITKWAERITEAGGIAAGVHEAFVQMNSGRPRPTEIEIPPETFAEQTDAALLSPATRQPVIPAEADLQKAAELLAGAATRSSLPAAARYSVTPAPRSRPSPRSCRRSSSPAARARAPSTTAIRCRSAPCG